MTYKPLLKVLGILIFAWILFFVAQGVFKTPTDTHLNLIPEDVDALIILNNKKLGEELFYQRVFNEEIYKKHVKIDESLERELTKDALDAGINFLSPIAVFSYGFEGHTIIGITCQSSNKSGLENFIKKYTTKAKVDLSFVTETVNNKAIVLLSPSLSAQEMQGELNDILNGEKGTVTDTPWWQELLKRKEQDLTGYLSPKAQNGSIISSFLNLYVPEIIKEHFLFVELIEDKILVSYEPVFDRPANEIINKSGARFIDDDLPAVLSLGIDIGAFMPSAPSECKVVIPSDSGKIILYTDSLINKNVFIGFNSVDLNISAASRGELPVNYDGITALKYNTEYWSGLKKRLMYAGVLKFENGTYIYTHKLKLMGLNLAANFSITEQNGYLLFQQGKSKHKSLQIEDGSEIPAISGHIDIEKTLNGIAIADEEAAKQLSKLGSIQMVLKETSGNKMVIELEITNTRDVHSLVDVMHIITNINAYVESAKDLIALPGLFL